MTLTNTEKKRIESSAKNRHVLIQHESMNMIVSLVETKFKGNSSIWSVFTFSKKAQMETSQETFTSLEEAKHEYERQIK